jgi:Helix-turn-helix domain
MSCDLRELKLLDEYDVADLLGVRVSIVRRRRARRLPPVYVRIGHHVKYRPQDIRSYIESMQANAPPGAEQMAETAA